MAAEFERPRSRPVMASAEGRLHYQGSVRPDDHQTGACGKSLSGPAGFLCALLMVVVLWPAAGNAQTWVATV
jgi:hypothetical protein